MRQYFNIKSKYPDAILLFRVGDFYETFAEDAISASNILGIVLTSRNNGGSDVELAGFPHHSLDVYLPRLVRAGYRVAICEQLEKPDKTKKIVKRGVTEMITPGLATGEVLLDHQANNFLCSLFMESDFWGISFLDISTGEFYISQGPKEHVSKLIQGFGPSEIIYARNQVDQIESLIDKDRFRFALDDWAFDLDNNHSKILNHFQVRSLKGFGVELMELGIAAAGASLFYLDTTENRNISHINTIKKIATDENVWIDEFTIRNLELVRAQHPSGVALLDVINKTKTAMGGRLLKKWILMPLLSLDKINQRLNAVEFLVENENLHSELLVSLMKLCDIERIVSKIALRKINPREFIQLKNSLILTKEIKSRFTSLKSPVFDHYMDRVHSCDYLIDLIVKTLNEEVTNKLSDGNIIKRGVDENLDELKSIISNAKALLLELQQKEANNTGITNLKIGFNNVFGYFLEVTNKYKNKGLIPDHWVRKQTLTNSERYITEELKTLEDKILNAEGSIAELEDKIYLRLIDSSFDYIVQIQQNAQIIAELDCFSGFKILAKEQTYVKPDLNNSLDIELTASRHPVIEAMMGPEQNYVPNDVLLSSEEQQIMMITGPNMSGKSALLRQVALISILAQMGSFVPARTAKLGIVDRIFSRVGASDNISSGESTFMVEMNETSSILNNLSPRSLILMDEIGRGTSTYDGVSIAWAIVEYLHENSIAKPKTMFATHYHELNELSNKFDRVVNFNIDTRVHQKDLIFLRKLIAGGSKHSFGILVAKMAGMPKTVVNRAEEVLARLEKSRAEDPKAHDIDRQLAGIERPIQMSMFDLADPDLIHIKEELESMDVNGLTPVESLMKLVEWQKKLKKLQN